MVTILKGGGERQRRGHWGSTGGLLVDLVQVNNVSLTLHSVIGSGLKSRKGHLELLFIIFNVN